MEKFRKKVAKPFTTEEECNCARKMPDCKSCTCIYHANQTDHATLCECECFDDPENYTRGNFGKLRINRDSIVNVSVRNMPLVHVGNILQRALREPIYIPAKNPYAKINLKVKRKKISAVMRKLGIVTRSQLPSKS